MNSIERAAVVIRQHVTDNAMNLLYLFYGVVLMLLGSDPVLHGWRSYLVFFGFGWFLVASVVWVVRAVRMARRVARAVSKATRDGES